jgi:hypothetical protein
LRTKERAKKRKKETVFYGKQQFLFLDMPLNLSRDIGDDGAAMAYAFKA